MIGQNLSGKPLGAQQARNWMGAQKRQEKRTGSVRQLRGKLTGFGKRPSKPR